MHSRTNLNSKSIVIPAACDVEEISPMVLKNIFVGLCKDYQRDSRQWIG